MAEGDGDDKHRNSVTAAPPAFGLRYGYRNPCPSRPIRTTVGIHPYEQVSEPIDGAVC